MLFTYKVPTKSVNSFVVKESSMLPTAQSPNNFNQ